MIHQRLKIKQIYCYYSLFNKYTKRCDMCVCNMIVFAICKFSVVGSSLYQTQKFFLLHNNDTQMKIMVLNNKDTSDANVYAKKCTCIYAYVRIKRVCAVNVYLSDTVGLRVTIYFSFLHVCICLLLQMEYILRAKRSELTSKLMLSGSDGLSNDLRKMDPETQARLETLLEAAGVLSIC